MGTGCDVVIGLLMLALAYLLLGIALHYYLERNTL
jgi:hypothetical protein